MPANVKDEHVSIADPGDEIVVESEKVGQPARKGEILKVTDSSTGPNFEVRWDDGRVTEFRPAAGSARIFRTKKGAAG